MHSLILLKFLLLTLQALWHLLALFFFTCRLKALPLVARESEKVLSSLPLAAREKRVTSTCCAWESGLFGPVGPTS